MADIKNPEYLAARIMLLEDAIIQFLAFLPEEAAIGISSEYSRRLAYIEKMFPDSPQSLIITREMS